MHIEVPNQSWGSGKFAGAVLLAAKERPEEVVISGETNKLLEEIFWCSLEN